MRLKIAFDHDADYIIDAEWEEKGLRWEDTIIMSFRDKEHIGYRLVKCFNACEGISDEDLVAVPALMVGMRLLAAEVAKLRDVELESHETMKRLILKAAEGR